MNKKKILFCAGISFLLLFVSVGSALIDLTGTYTASDTLTVGSLQVIGDVNISGNLQYGSIHYAEMWFHNNTGGTTTEIATQNVWYNMTFTPSEDSGQKLNGFTYALVGGTGVLTCQVAGRYSIDYKVSCGHAGGGSEEYQWQIYVNEEEQNNTDAHRKISTGGDVGSASGGGFIDLFVGDTVYLKVTNRGGTRNLETHALNVNLIRIGDC